MQTFEGVIEKMVREGVLTQEGALPYSTNANNLRLRQGDLSGQAAIPKVTDVLREEDSMIGMIER